MNELTTSHRIYICIFVFVSLMRMTTFNPFQYQVQSKLMIQISDNIGYITATVVVVANLPIVIWNTLACIFIWWLRRCYYLINSKIENDALFITQIRTTNSNNWDSEWKYTVSINFGRIEICMYIESGVSTTYTYEHWTDTIYIRLRRLQWVIHCEYFTLLEKERRK